MSTIEIVDDKITPVHIVKSTEASIIPALIPVVDLLLHDGFAVYYHQQSDRAAGVTWIIVERDGNVGTIQYNDLDGYSVSFSIRPDHTYGSALHVTVPGTKREPYTPADVLACAGVATQDRYRNHIVPATLSNHGMKHFHWMRDHFVQVIQ